MHYEHFEHYAGIHSKCVIYKIIVDGVGREGTAVSSVRPSVRLFLLSLLNQLTFGPNLLRVCMTIHVALGALKIKVKVRVMVRVCRYVEQSW